MGVATHILILLALAAGGGDPPAPRTQITPILHTGDPAPGIPDATMVWIGIPEIDAAGNVLIYGFFQFDGQATAHTAIWYGGAGTLQLIAYDDMQAPHLPTGVVFDFLFTGRLSESGWIGYAAVLKGPGIVPGVNDMANFAGPPGDIRNILQGGDPAPGLEPGTVIDVSEGFGLTAWLSDNATLLVIAWLSGPDIDESNDKAIWIGPRDDLQLIWRKGTVAPGTDGARFDWSDGIKHNDTQIAFRGGLVHEGEVDHTNDVGLWTGVVGTLQLLVREGDPAPDVEGDAWFLDGGFASLGSSGEVAFARALAGEGITEDNDTGIWAGIADDIDLISREGNPVPGLEDSIRYDQMSQQIVSAEGKIAIRVRFRGAVTPSNDHALMFGGLDTLHVRLREGDSVLGQILGTVYDDLLFSKIAMNDSSDLISYAGIAGPDVSPTEDVVLMFGDHRTGLWYPVVRSGDVVAGGTILIPDPADASELIHWDTGGSDGGPQSLNDSRQVAARLTFTDATHGTYLIEVPDFADPDGNGTVDLLDFDAFLSCVTGPGSGELAPECFTFDVDWDGDIDFADFWGFQLLFGGSE